MSGPENKTLTARIELLKLLLPDTTLPHDSFCNTGPGRAENRAETARIEALKRKGPGAL